MVTWKEITTQAERKSVYPDRRVELPRLTKAPFPSPEHMQWVKDNWWMADYSVLMTDKKLAMQLACELEQIFAADANHPKIPAILDELRRIKMKPRGEKSALEIWTHSAYQCVSYSGGPDVTEIIERRLQRYSGMVLEAMCGHTSYLPESPTRTVIALDYCAISLERYLYPWRCRIECDLNQVHGKVSLPFFQDEQFDAISICFGYSYPEHIDALVREFRRILKPRGVLSFVENPYHAYERLRKRKFSKKKIRSVLLHNGYTSVSIKKLPVRQWDSFGSKFYHVEAVK